MSDYRDHHSFRSSFRKRVIGGTVPCEEHEASIVTVEVKTLGTVRQLTFSLPDNRYDYETFVDMLDQAFEHGRDSARAEIRAAIGVLT